MKYEVFWKNPSYKIRKELKEDIQCDYLIVGGGVTGVSLAYFLNKLGAKNIVLIERDFIASGATGKAAGTLVVRGEDDLNDLLVKHEKEKAKKFWFEIYETLQKMYELIKKEKIDCEAEPQDTLYCSKKHYFDKYLKKEYVQEKSLDEKAKLLQGEELKKELNSPIYTHGILSKNHGLSVNPLKFTQNLSKILDKIGIKIYEKTNFLGFKKNIAKTQKGKIKFKKIILAIDKEHPASEVQNEKTTIVITRTLNKEELIKTGLTRKKIIWDPKRSYDYFKVTEENKLLVGFGRTIVHKKHKINDPHFPHLQHIKLYIKKLFPYLNLPIEYVWSAGFGITENRETLIEFDKNFSSIAGAGTQPGCFLAAKYVAERLINGKSSLDYYFK